jgi:hypothetical protein
LVMNRLVPASDTQHGQPAQWDDEQDVRCRRENVWLRL